MAEGRDRQEWEHTSQILALLANGLCRQKGRAAFRPEQFNPHEQRRLRDARRKQTQQTDTKKAFRGLRGLFGGGNGVR